MDVFVRFAKSNWKWIVIVIGGIFLFLTSTVTIDSSHRGHLKRVFGKDLAPGQVIAANGEAGPQAELIQPGFHFSLFIHLTNDIEEFEIVEVPDGMYGYLIAKDGAPLRPDQTYADAFAPELEQKMIGDAEFFLRNGGQKGPQTSVLRPGNWPLNMYLWEVQINDSSADENERTTVTDIPPGFVGVVKSNVWSAVYFGDLRNERPDQPVKIVVEGGIAVDSGEVALAVPLVETGCMGLWKEPLNSGKYYINKKVYHVTLVDTRVVTWEYKGGWTNRQIDLTLADDGSLQQNEIVDERPVPESAADPAINCKVEGWDVPVELRVQVQIAAADASYVVGSVGSLQMIEDKILTPVIRSITRNEVGDKTVRVMQLIDDRVAIESKIERGVRPEAKKAKVDVQDIRMADVGIPPELLLGRKRQQLAGQLKEAYTQERIAQHERIATEAAKAEADQQATLVQAQIQVEVEENLAAAEKFKGQGQRDRLMLEAEGQEAMMSVLGSDNVMQITLQKNALDFMAGNDSLFATLIENADRFVPYIQVNEGFGGNNSLSTAALLFGAMNSGLGPWSKVMAKPYADEADTPASGDGE